MKLKANNITSDHCFHPQLVEFHFIVYPICTLFDSFSFFAVSMQQSFTCVNHTSTDWFTLNCSKVFFSSFFFFLKWIFSHSLNWKGIIDAGWWQQCLHSSSPVCGWKAVRQKKLHKMYGNEENNVTYQWIGKKFVLVVVEKKTQANKQIANADR